MIGPAVLVAYSYYLSCIIIIIIITSRFPPPEAGQGMGRVWESDGAIVGGHQPLQLQLSQTFSGRKGKMALQQMD